VSNASMSRLHLTHSSHRPMCADCQRAIRCSERSELVVFAASALPCCEGELNEAALLTARGAEIHKGP
jgi:hypothetical protein